MCTKLFLVHVMEQELLFSHVPHSYAFDNDIVLLTFSNNFHQPIGNSYMAHIIWEPIIKLNLKTIWKRSWEIEEIILFSSLNNNFSSFLFELNKYFIKYYFIYFSRYLSAWNDFVAIDSDLAPPTELDPCRFDLPPSLLLPPISNTLCIQCIVDRSNRV